MNILVIGNGFDLAHGLPTRYTDFLEFIKVIKQSLSKNKLAGIDWGNIDAEVKKFLISNKGKVQEKLFSDWQIWENFINNNIWIKHFLAVYKKRENDGKNGWIDFESEISEVIQSLDNEMHGLSQVYKMEDTVSNLSNEFLEARYSDFIAKVQPINPVDNGFSKEITFKEIRNILLNDLNKFIRALEMYLCDYVEKIEIGKKSPDIDALEIDFILSFNYTHTYSKLYDVSSCSKQEVSDPFDYIHGEADINNTIVTNNMVLGIDEYLSKKRRNKDIEFIAFKKYYQRIHKQTGCKYKEWVDQISNEYNQYQRDRNEIGIEILKSIDDKSFDIDPFLKNKYTGRINKQCPQHNLYVFGHSLDVTDKDILRDLILHDNVHTTIFYYEENNDNGRTNLGKQIANLVKVIGQDELIKRTGGRTKTIEFKLQQDMVEIEDNTTKAM